MYVVGLKKSHQVFKVVVVCDSATNISWSLEGERRAPTEHKYRMLVGLRQLVQQSAAETTSAACNGNTNHDEQSKYKFCYLVVGEETSEENFVLSDCVPEFKRLYNKCTSPATLENGPGTMIRYLISMRSSPLWDLLSSVCHV